MPLYKYTGTDNTGKLVKGTIEAEHKEDVQGLLRKEEIFMHDVMLAEGEKKEATYKKLKAKELSDFSRQVGTLQRTGVPVMRSISMMLENDITPNSKIIYEKIFGIISNGNTLSSAMQQCGNAFPSLMVNMYTSGESSGKLDDTAMKMAEYYAAEYRLNEKIKSAMAYPTLLGIMTVGITLGLFTLVLPNFFDVFESSGVPLNAITQAVIDISHFIINKWLILLIGTVCAVLVWRIVSKIPAVELKIDKMRIDMPKIGKLCSIIYSARFARTLSSLYSSGVSMLEAVEISVKTIGNSYIEQEFPTVIDKISSGKALSEALDGTDGIQKKLVSTIFIGEESGRLDEVLIAVSEEYEFESDIAIEKMLTYIEPIMIVLMAVIVGFVMVAVMVPIMEMSQTIK